MRTMRLVPIEHCLDDCPYFLHCNDGSVACDLQRNNNADYEIYKKVSYVKNNYDGPFTEYIQTKQEAIKELLLECPLFTLDDILVVPEQVIYEKYRNLLK